MNKYDKDTFEIMVNEWLSDHAEEMADLEITEIRQGDEGWEASARDEKTEYVLTDDGTGNIKIDYIGTR